MCRFAWPGVGGVSEPDAAGAPRGGSDRFQAGFGFQNLRGRVAVAVLVDFASSPGQDHADAGWLAKSAASGFAVTTLAIAASYSARWAFERSRGWQTT